MESSKKPKKIFTSIYALVAGSAADFQQDGAKPHTGLNNVAALEAAGSLNGWTVIFKTQPPNLQD
jgi:hypothetical protein